MLNPTHPSNKIAGIAILAVVLLSCASPVHAQDRIVDGYLLNLELGVLQSDNPLGNSPRGPSDTLMVPRAEFDVHRHGSQWTARGSGYMEYRVALDNVVEDEFRANLAAALDWTLLPGSLDWTFQNVASVEPIDFLGTDSSGNLQQTNIFMTGPTWQIRPMSRWGGVVDARYTHSYAEESEAFNSDRVSVSGRLLHRFDVNRQMSLGAEVTDVRYRDSDVAATDYERLDLLARYRSQAAQTELEVAGGHTWIEPEQGQSITAPLARIHWTWNRNDHNSIRILALHEQSDSTRQLSGEIDQIGRPFAGVSRMPVDAELFQLTSIEPSWHYRHPRGHLSVRTFYRELEFEFAPASDFHEIGTNLDGSWRLRPLTTLLASLGLERRKFSSEQRRDTDHRASLFLEHRFTQRWSARAGATRYQRSSSVAGADSREHIYAVYLTFRAGR